MARIARLRVLETLANGGIQSYRVIDTADGSKLIVHYGDLSLLDVADKLGPDVLERGESGGKLYLLTPDRPEFENLNGRPSPQPAKPTPAAAEPGEFTRMFQIPVNKPEKTAPEEFTGPFRSAFGSSDQPAVLPNEPKSVPPNPQPAAPEPSFASSDLGFTGMFSAASRISADIPPKPNPKPPASEPVTPAFLKPTSPEAPLPNELPQRPPAAVSSEFTSLFRAQEAPPPVPQAPIPVSKPEANSEFTRLFQAPPAPPSRPPESPEPQRARPLDGEFTRMFQAQAPHAAVPPPSAPVPPPPKQPASEEPGAFTRMFQAPPPAATPEKISLPPKPQSSQDSGEFTRFFQNPLPSAREPDWKALQNQPSAPPAPKPEGDFTRMFGRPSGSNSPAKPSPSAEGATDLFQKPKGAAPSAPGPKTTTDDFSKQFGASAPAAPKPASPPAVALPAVVPVQLPVKKPPVLILIVIVVALLVLAGCAIYYFVIKPK